MAILSTIKIVVNGNQAKRELNRIESGFGRVAGKIRGIGAALGVGGGILGFAGVFKALKDSVSAAGDIEVLRVAFTNLSGSADVANDILKELEGTAKKTGVSVNDQADAVRKFLALGFEPERALKLQKAILDVAGSMGLTSFQAGQLGFAISQVAAKGCHGVDSPIRMADGSIKLVQDIKVGDELMGPDGQPRMVLVLARGEQELYKIEPENSEAFVVNLDHQMRLVDREAGETQTVRLRDYLEMDEMDLAHSDGAVPFNFSSVGEGEFFGFSITGDHLYRDAAGFEHHNTVSMEELRQQIAEKGIPIFDALAEKIGVSKGELIKLVSEGKVPAERLLEIFENYEGQFAKFEGGAEDIGKTFKGVFNRIIATALEASRAFGDPIAEALKPTLEGIQEDIDKTREAFRSLGGAIASAFTSADVDFSGAFKSFLETAPQLVNQIKSTLGNVLSVTKGLGAAIIPVGAALAKSATLIATVTGAWLAYKAALIGVKVLDVQATFVGREIQLLREKKALDAASNSYIGLLNKRREDIAATQAQNKATSDLNNKRQKAVANLNVAKASTDAYANSQRKTAAVSRKAGKVEAETYQASAIARERVSIASKRLADSETKLSFSRSVIAGKGAVVIADAERNITAARTASEAAFLRLAAAERTFLAARSQGPLAVAAAERELNQARSEASLTQTVLAKKEDTLAKFRAGLGKKVIKETAALEKRVTAARRELDIATKQLKFSETDRAKKAQEGAERTSAAIQKETLLKKQLTSATRAASLAEREYAKSRAAAIAAGFTVPRPVGGAAQLAAINARTTANLASESAKTGTRVANSFSGRFLSGLGATFRSVPNLLSAALTFGVTYQLASELFGKQIGDYISRGIKQGLEEDLKKIGEDTTIGEIDINELFKIVRNAKTEEEIKAAGEVIEKTIREVQGNIKEAFTGASSFGAGSLSAGVERQNEANRNLVLQLRKLAGGLGEFTSETEIASDKIKAQLALLDAQAEAYNGTRLAAEFAAQAQREFARAGLEGEALVSALEKELGDLEIKLKQPERAEESIKGLRSEVDALNQELEALGSGANNLGVAERIASIQAEQQGYIDRLREIKEEQDKVLSSEDFKKLQEQYKNLTKELLKAQEALKALAFNADDAEKAIAEINAASLAEAEFDQLSAQEKLNNLYDERLEIIEKIKAAENRDEGLELANALQSKNKEIYAEEKEALREKQKWEKFVADDAEEYRKYRIDGQIAERQAVLDRLKDERSASAERERLEKIGVRFGGRGGGLPGFLKSDLLESGVEGQIDLLKKQIEVEKKTYDAIEELPARMVRAFSAQEPGAGTCPVGTAQNPFGGN